MGWWWHLVSCAIEPLIELHSNGPQGRDYPKTQGPTGIAELGHYMYAGGLWEDIGGLPFAYTREQMAAFGGAQGYRMDYIGAWGHPRDQVMVVYRHQD